MSETADFIRKLEAAYARRHGEIVELRGVTCEACGTKIPRYIGPKAGIVCSTCLQVSPSYCGNTRPGDWTGDKDYELPDNYQ